MDVKLIVVGGSSAGLEVPVAGPKFFVGRSEDCHLRPKSDLVSRHHAVILVEEGFVAVRDFGSKNGTFVNGEKIRNEREVKTGDRLKFGPLEFEVQLSVEVGGKKKPKVHNVQEAAARTVETAAAADTSGDEDVDIFNLLGEEDDAPADDAAPTTTADTKPISAAETASTNLDAGKAIGPSVYTPEETPPEEPKKKKEKQTSAPGRFQKTKGPTSQDTQSAADDVLRQFFGRK